MRVALDGRWLQLRPYGGVGRTLSRLLPLVPPDVSIDLLTDRRWPPADVGLPEHALGGGAVRHSTTWLQWSAARWLTGYDGVFHCPFYALPFRQPVPMVVTLHDLTFETHPEWFPRGRAQVFRVQARHAARTARRVITVSEHVRGEINARYGVPPERIVVASPAVDPVFAPDRDATAVRQALGITGRFVVALAGAPRRNIDLAVAAWRELRRTAPDVQLVVVGRSALPAENGLLQAGRLDDESWASVLSSAELLLYPTGDEGFGMPALEAAASGTPVVCGRVGSLPEVLGPAGGWVDELSASALADRMQQLLSDETGRLQLRSVGLDRAARAPGWAETAAAHAMAWRAAAGQD